MSRPRPKKPVEKSTAAEPAPAVDDSSVRGRPGRRSVEDRQDAILELLSGKATADQIARRLGVLPATVEGWRSDALAGISEALRRGSGKSAREQELERENKQLRDVVTKKAIQNALLEQALDTERAKRPTGPAKWRR